MVARFLNLFKREIDHTRARELSSDYIDGDMDDGTAAQVKSHLEWCPPCQAFFETLKATVNLLGSSDRHKPSPSFLERLRDRLRSEAGR